MSIANVVYKVKLFKPGMIYRFLLIQRSQISMNESMLSEEILDSKLLYEFRCSLKAIVLYISFSVIRVQV